MVHVGDARRLVMVGHAGHCRWGLVWLTEQTTNEPIRKDAAEHAHHLNDFKRMAGRAKTKQLVHPNTNLGRWMHNVPNPGSIVGLGINRTTPFSAYRLATVAPECISITPSVAP